MSAIFVPCQLLDMDLDSDEEADGGATARDAQRKGRSGVVKTRTRQVRWSSIALPVMTSCGVPFAVLTRRFAPPLQFLCTDDLPARDRPCAI
jgi:hypothetical protein